MPITKEQLSSLADKLVPELVQVYADHTQRWRDRNQDAHTRTLAWVIDNWNGLVRPAVEDIARDLESLSQEPGLKPLIDIMQLETDLLSPLGQIRREVAHTQLVSYFLDPKQSHQLGPKAIEALIDNLSFRYRGAQSRLEALKSDAPHAHVQAELPFNLESEDGGRTDVWIEFPQNRPQYLMVIENKIDAVLTDAQLDNYERALKERANAFAIPPDKIFPVVLAQHFEFSPRANWMLVRWRDLALSWSRLYRGRGAGTQLLGLYIASILRGLEGITYPPSSLTDKVAVRIAMKRALGIINWHPE